MFPTFSDLGCCNRKDSRFRSGRNLRTNYPALIWLQTRKAQETAGNLIQAIFNALPSISSPGLLCEFKQVFQLQSTILDAEKLDIKAG
jgi:hypothetical protein